ncbi:beta-ketoacyl synthase N-terminal-like domain-containing protein [Paracoccus sp. (in: a-proteobacteria)]|uniref:beta-ketoacyl synthase N-terminal-like domain-containing protein n=1 Tax=Paracoccus sp. TaxID=267 RepID=UPI003A8C3692
MTGRLTITGGCCFDDHALVCLRQKVSLHVPGDAAGTDLPDTIPDAIKGRIRMLYPTRPPEGGTIRHFRSSRLIADCVAAAFGDAGLQAGDVEGSDTGFVSGSYYGCAEFLDTLRESLHRDGPRAIRPTDFSIATHGYPMAALGMAYRATGPSTAFLCGPASVTEALAFARTMLDSGLTRRMVVVGYELLGPQTRRHHARLSSGALTETVACLVLEGDRGQEGVPLPRYSRTVGDPARLGAAPLHALLSSLLSKMVTA